jgi:hypothetical protein
MFRCLSTCAVASFLLLGRPLPATAQHNEWKPIEPADLALKAPKVESDADAEALLWEVRVADEMSVSYELELSTVFHHYVRIKIFTDRGREGHATVDIPYVTGMEVRDVAARTTRPDGTTVDLKRSDIYKRTIVKANDLKVQVVSFAVPAIERGAIIEYRWREVYRDSLASHLRLPFSREIPVHLVRYYVRPLDFDGALVMSAIPFNATFSNPQEVKDGYTMVSLSNVPADREEPYTVPPFERRPWMFIYYQPRSAATQADFWPKFSRSLHEEYGKRTKPNDEIRQLGASAQKDATATARVAALVRLVHEKVKRTDVDTADVKDRSRARENKNASDVLKRGVGTGDDALVLFLALANAAGLEARVAASPNRADLFHKPHHQNPYFVRGRIAAVRDGADWIFVDPSNEHSAVGDLPWYYEWQHALIADPKEVLTKTTPLAAASKSAKRRLGTFKLAEDGTLEGECTVAYTGHWGVRFREEDDHEAPAERERALKEALGQRLPGVEVSEIRVENIADPAQPYKQAYRIRVPGYAQRTGSRLFFQPAVFQKGVGAIFSAPARSSDVYFPFAWTEEDDVSIELPAGFELEQPEGPPAIEAGAARWTLDLLIGTEAARNRLLVKRTFAMGLTKTVLFPQKTYPALKQFFDRVYSQDGHTLVLRRKAPQ